MVLINRLESWNIRLVYQLHANSVLISFVRFSDKYVVEKQAARCS